MKDSTHTDIRTHPDAHTHIKKSEFARGRERKTERERDAY